DAGASGAQRRPVRVLAELGQGDAESVHGVQHRGARGDFDVRAVYAECDGHARSHQSRLRLPRYDTCSAEICEFPGELLEGGQDRERRRLTKPAEGGQPYDLAQLLERRAPLAVAPIVQEIPEPRRALPAWGALAAGLAGVEGEQGAHDVAKRGTLIQ